MIAQFTGNRPSWQQALRQAYRRPLDLLTALNISPQDMPFSLAALQQFSMRVPQSFAACMRKGDLNDPLLKQVLPVQQELESYSFDQIDPLQEIGISPTPGLLHKYADRVLITLSASCAIQCRYCFRRHFPYEEHALIRHWPSHYEYIQEHSEIHEVILSGGDPLLISDKKLSEVIKCLDKIPHLKRLRIHSRIPIVLPERMTASLLECLQSTRLTCVLVTHSNHANELSVDVQRGLEPYRQAGIALLNQSVLLKGVNDSLNSLSTLHERLFQIGVLPYYLHLLDPVAGAGHFAIPRSRAQQLHQQLIHRTSGYLVPKLVQEIPGQPGKTWINIEELA